MSALPLFVVHPHIDSHAQVSLLFTSFGGGRWGWGGGGFFTMSCISD